MAFTAVIVALCCMCSCAGSRLSAEDQGGAAEYFSKAVGDALGKQDYSTNLANGQFQRVLSAYDMSLELIPGDALKKKLDGLSSSSVVICGRNEDTAVVDSRQTQIVPSGSYLVATLARNVEGGAGRYYLRSWVHKVSFQSGSGDVSEKYSVLMECSSKRSIPADKIVRYIRFDLPYGYALDDVRVSGLPFRLSAK